MSISVNRWRTFGVVIVTAAFVGVAALPAQLVAEGSHSRVFPPVSQYAALSAQWWQWILAIPVSTNPGLDDSGAACAVDQSGPVWFLAGTFTGSPVSRVCTVPAGKALFFPLVNATWIAFPEDDVRTKTVEFARSTSAIEINAVDRLQASIDGRVVNDLFGYRALSRAFSFVLPTDNIFGIVAGPDGPTVSDGYWLLVAPLSRGTHVIHLGGRKRATTIPLPDTDPLISPAFEVDVTYTLHVERQM